MRKHRKQLVGLFAAVLTLTSGISLLGGFFEAEFSGLNGRKVSRKNFESLIQELDGLEGQTITPTDIPATLSVVELQEGIVRHLSKIQSMHVAVDISTTLTEAGRAISPRFTSSYFESYLDPHPLTGQQTELIGAEYTFLGDKTKDDVRQKTKNKDGTSEVSTITSIFDGEKTVSCITSTAIGGKEPKATVGGNPLVGRVEPGNQLEIENYAPPSSEIMFSYLDPTHLPMGCKKAEDLDAVMGNPQQCRVKPTLEKVDGHSCHVVISTGNSIWVDQDHGFVVRRIVTFESPDTEITSLKDLIRPQQTAELTTVVMCQNIESCHGVQLPRLIHRLHFSRKAAGPKTWGKLTLITEVTATKLTVNETTDADFVSPVPPGFGVIDMVRKKIYWMPKDPARLEEAIALGTDIIPGRTRVPGPLPDHLYPGHEKALREGVVEK